MITNNGLAAQGARQPLPLADTPVLLNRPVRHDARQDESVYGDDRWNLTPGIFEEHARGSSIPWHSLSDGWREPTKRYFWLLINDEDADAVTWSNVKRLGLRSIIGARRVVQMFLEWCDVVGIADLNDFDQDRQEVFLTHVLDLDVQHKVKQSLLLEVRRIWTHREILDAPLRMPAGAPWGGESPSQLVGKDTRPAENLRVRIADATLHPLLVWSFRYIEDFAEDITVAQKAWVSYDTNRPKRREPAIRGGDPSLSLRVQATIDDFRSQGRPLPARTRYDHVILDLRHLGNLIGCRAESLRVHQEAFIQSGLPMEVGAFARRAAQGKIDGENWMPEGISYDATSALARHLVAACFIVISYLSGMRPGEVLNLRRGCATTDRKTRISVVRGKHFKSVLMPDGSHNPEGEIRKDPWVVHPSVVRAIHVLESLHEGDLLFPASLMPGKLDQSLSAPDNETRRTQGARADNRLNMDIVAFTEWVNGYCARRDRPDTIPPEARGAVTGSRFRRTLAWHIVRQPRGLVAAAIQYGHVHTSITQGYGGSADSGFADELAFETWLVRIESISRENAALTSGGQVSGPAAAEFIRRVSHGDDRFAGRVHMTGRQAQKSLAYPAIQVFQGRGMHCVMNVATAACLTTPGGRTEVLTPDIDDCRPRCTNIARTDDDIAQVRADADRLEEVANDPLAPPIRASRERAEAARLRAIIAEHERTL
ncbi:hypothetical protein [Cryobacterium sp. MDB2-10]|uniref:hypothetical protein n=1 Tax=Cryobacterium sp. MDB2-10 TaxID=1259177 RepID=UPI00107324FB|nr:hypothetical protein [Cryobacterium sp. MDB2-10]TFC17150.1 hypothetical protein E3O51_11550 [Cryobacterium sp. MDB2-10]